MGNQQDVVRVTCCKENCGTFPMDGALVRKLKRTGETWACPGGHRQHFTESTESKLRERIAELEKRVEQQKERYERSRERARDLFTACREEKKLRENAEQALLDRSTGVVMFGEERFKWACECGGNGTKGFESEDDARKAWRDHRRREGCGDAMPEDVIPVADA